MEYTFPFSTCERPNVDGIAQPYSSLLNVMNSILILYFLLQTKHLYTFFLLFFIFWFEVVHAFSHIIHIPGTIQATIIHLLAGCINASLFFFFYTYLKTSPANWFLLFCTALVGLDIYLFLNSSILYYFFSQILLFVSIISYYYPLLSPYIQNKMKTIFILVVAIFLLFLNEKYNCEKMMEVYTLPYHGMIEILGIVLFYILCSTFYQL